MSEWRVSPEALLVSLPLETHLVIGAIGDVLGGFMTGCIKCTTHVLRITIYVFLFLALSSHTFAKEESNVFLRTDQRFFNSIYDEPPEATGLHQTMEGITRFGDTEVTLGIALALSAFGDERTHETGKLMSSAIIGTGVTIYCLKKFTGRQRPLEDQPGQNMSFPSGHTGFSFTMATVLGQEYPKWRIPVYLGATLIGVSRIYLGRHYPSDVVVGSLIGTLVGWQVTAHKEMVLKWEF